MTSKINLAQVLKAYDYADNHPHKYLRGTTNWCAAVAHSLNEQAAPEAPRQEPEAWIRRWAADGITPEKVLNENGRWAWPFKFKLVPVSQKKCLPDDVALYAEPQPPLSPDLIHDRAYRNGLMAGFQFGIIGNEKGYATAINKFNTEIHAAKADPLSPDHSGGGAGVVLPERMTFTGDEVEPISISYDVAAGWNACLDKVKDLNQ